SWHGCLAHVPWPVFHTEPGCDGYSPRSYFSSCSHAASCFCLFPSVGLEVSRPTSAIQPLSLPPPDLLRLPERQIKMTTPTRSTYIASRLLTGENGEQIDNAAITLDGNNIVWVGKADKLPSEPGEIIDCGEDSTILPGLI